MHTPRGTVYKKTRCRRENGGKTNSERGRHHTYSRAQEQKSENKPRDQVDDLWKEKVVALCYASCVWVCVGVGVDVGVLCTVPTFLRPSVLCLDSATARVVSSVKQPRLNMPSPLSLPRLFSSLCYSEPS